MTIRRYASIAFYLICLILAFGYFYFTISEPLFAWLIGDEWVLSQSYHNVGGFFACTSYYYLHTTVNRLSADVAGCFMAQTASYFSTPFMGWVFDRLVWYVLMPLSLAFLLKEITKIPFKFGLIVALTICSTALFIAFNSIYYAFGLDLAIYGTAAVSFFFLIALFPKSLENRRYFVWFCIVYAINLASHELCLVISGFFIPIYAWYRHSSPHFIKKSLKDRRVQILLAIYVVFALTALLAPGVGIREKIWPTSGTFSDGMAYMLLSMEEVIYFIARSYIFVILFVLLGIIFRFFVGDRYSFKNKLIYVLLFSAPLVYFIVMGFLIGISPTIWTPSIRPDTYRFIDSFLRHFLTVTNKNIFNYGGFYTSRVMFPYMMILLNFFLAGFLLTGVFVKKRFAKESVIEKTRPLVVTLFLMVSVIFLFHPDGMGSMRILSTFFKSNIDLAHYSPQKSKAAHPESSIIHFISPSVSAFPTVSSALFPRSRSASHESNVAIILLNDYLKAHRNKGISLPIFYTGYDLMIKAYKDMEKPAWQRMIFPMYHVFAKEPCLSFSKSPKKTGSYCYSTFGGKNLPPLLTHKKLTAPVSIGFKNVQGIKIKNLSEGCLSLVDTPNKGEHYIQSDDISLSKGYYYFTFETKPTKTELYLQIFGKKDNFTLSWLNTQSNNNPIPLTPWGNISKSASLKPIFSQIEATPNSEKLRVVVYSAIKQKFHLRWLHGYGHYANLSFKGRKDDFSSICKAQFGKIVG